MALYQGLCYFTEEYNYYQVGILPSRFYAALTGKSLPEFKDILWKMVIIVVSLCIVSTLMITQQGGGKEGRGGEKGGGGGGGSTLMITQQGGGKEGGGGEKGGGGGEHQLSSTGGTVSFFPLSCLRAVLQLPFIVGSCGHDCYIEKRICTQIATNSSAECACSVVVLHHFVSSFILPAINESPGNQWGGGGDSSSHKH